MDHARSALSVLAMLAMSFVQCSRDASAEAARPRTPATVLVSLYTSEGCSSCPPADAVLASLDKTVRDDGITVVPLSFHVDYWNYLGWADPYSTAANSERQQKAARALGSRVYTPQAFVDGATDLVGSDTRALESAIVTAARAQKGDVALSLRIDGKNLIVDASSAALGPGTELVVVVIQPRAEVSVARGENGGKHLVHTNVVRALDVEQPSADRRARAKLALPDTLPRDGARVVAIVEDASNMRVLGVASGALPSAAP